MWLTFWLRTQGNEYVKIELLIERNLKFNRVVSVLKVDYECVIHLRMMNLESFKECFDDINDERWYKTISNFIGS